MEREPAGQCAALRRSVVVALPQLLAGPEHRAVRPASTGHARRSDLRHALCLRPAAAARAGPRTPPRRDGLTHLVASGVRPTLHLRRRVRRRRKAPAAPPLLVL